MPTKGVSVTDIVYLSPELYTIKNAQNFIFTSQYGVTGFKKFMAYHNQSLSPDFKAFCIGDHTAHIAEEIGFHHIYKPSISDGNALGELIKQRAVQNMDTSFVYIAGKIRKPYLETFLNQHHIPYVIQEVYNTPPIPNISLKIQKFITDNCPQIICFSMRQAYILYDLIPNPKHYAWHIIGKKHELNISLPQVNFYSTPQRLYEFFSTSSS